MPGFPANPKDETDLLLGFLDQQRQLVRLATWGLDDEAARMTPSASELSLGGIVKHLANVERSWRGLIEQTPRPSSETSVEDYQAGFQLGADETLAGALASYAEAIAATDTAVRQRSLDDEVPVPKDVPWFPQDVEAWSLRWVILHLIEETARHAGHADIVRESHDGATWFPLLAATEGMPYAPWVQPWRPREIRNRA